MAKTRMKKIITAGLLTVEAIYPRIERADSRKTRAAKRRASSEAQKRMNAVYSWQKCEWMIAANFRPGDLWITVTYDDAHLPKSRNEAQLRFKYFLSKLNSELRRQGREAVVLWNAEHKHQHESFWEDRRWHHHFFLNAGGEDFEMIRRLWIYGSNVEIRVLDLHGEHSYEALARYMCKEARDKPGLRCWSYTRNARRPEIETFRVESDTTVQAPKGSRVLMNEGGDKPVGWRVVKYLAAGWDRHAKPGAGRRRRRR